MLMDTATSVITEQLEKLISKVDIKLNQNLWVLITGYLGIGFSELYCLKILLLFSIVLSIFATI